MKKELTKAVNGYIANVGVNYIKLHNLHWNVTGPQFKAVHEYLESLYDGMADRLDATAELLKIHGEQPLASMKDYLAAATIKETDSRELPAAEALNIAKKDLEALKAQAVDIRKGADEDDLFDIIAQMEDDITDYNKTLWFLSAMEK